MTTLSEYHRIGEDLERLLNLRTSPLAIKMLEKEEDIPGGAIRPKKDRGCHLAQCQAFALSRRQRLSVAMLKEDSWCWGPLVGYGLVDPRPAENEDATRDQIKILPCLERNKYVGILSAPLKSANFEPDLLLIYSNTAQLRHMLMVIKQQEKALVTSQFDPIDSCVYAVVPVLQTRQYRITLPDPGDFERALAGEDEIILSVPREKLEGFISGLRFFAKKKRGYFDFNYEMRPDAPQPEFYSRLFRAWGLDNENS
jgi:uncharacterized protein (DUF169 family)